MEESQHSDSARFLQEFYKKKPKYENLGVNIVQALTIFLKELDISYLSIGYRIKDEKSFSEKIERKLYKEPLSECEDLCGIRIICYYQSDVDKISNIIRDEFTVLENEDKQSLLDTDQFGYRSNHFIVKIKKKWLNAPNYRGLEDFKAEIQVRTILMHSWAEIQHKLAYKRESHIPHQFRRKLSRISAKLEEADEQFEEMREKITSYKEDIAKKSDDIFDAPLELNLDSLQAFLDAKFPDLHKDISLTRFLLEECVGLNISLKVLSEAYNSVGPFLPQIGKEIFGDNPITWYQIGAVRNVMDIAPIGYFEYRLKSLKAFPSKRKLVERWRKKIYDKQVGE